MTQNSSKKNTTNTSGFGGFDNTNFADFFGKAMDFSSIKNTATRNFETAAAANQLGVQSMQAITRRMAEFIQLTTHRGMECARDSFGSKTPEEAQTRNADYASYMLQNYCNNAKEITQLFTKAATEMLDIYNKRAIEAISESKSN